jgi:hypothetical protein
MTPPQTNAPTSPLTVVIDRVSIALGVLSRWTRAVFPFVSVIIIQIGFAGFGQYQDLLRRETSSGFHAFFLLAASLGLILALFSCVRRSVDSFLGSTTNLNLTPQSIIKIQQLTVAFIAALLLAVHLLAWRSLSQDPVLSPGKAREFWKWIGLAIIIATGLLQCPGVIPWLYKKNRPFRLAAKLIRDTGKVTRLHRWAGLILVSAAILVGIALVSPWVLMSYTQKFSFHTLAVLQIVFTIYALVFDFFRTLCRPHRSGVQSSRRTIPLVPAAVFVLTISSVISWLLGSTGTEELDKLAVDTLPTRVEPLSLKEALEKRPPTDPIVIFVAEGGGIHAAYRSAIALALLEEKVAGGFWSRVFATSTVSGGSVGTALFGSLYADRPRTEVPFMASAFSQTGPFGFAAPAMLAVDPGATERGLDLSRLASKAASKDFLMPVFLRMAFSEPLGILLPIKGFDKGKALSIAMEGAVEASLKEAGVSPKNPAIRRGVADFGGPKEPYYCFNTTSADTGSRLVFSRLQIPSADSHLNYEGTRDISVATAASLSARFPLFPGAGRVPMFGATDTSMRILDGGVYDNSGLMTAMDLAYGVLKADPKRKIILVVVGNNVDYQGLNAPPKVTRDKGKDLAEKPRIFAEAAAYGVGALNSLLAKNKEAAQDVARLDSHPQVSIVQFVWSGELVNAPLGWYMDERRNRLISWMLGVNEYHHHDGGAAKLEDSLPDGWNLSDTSLSRTAKISLQKSMSGSGNLDLDVKSQAELALRIRRYNLDEINRLAVELNAPINISLPTGEPSDVNDDRS